MLEGGLAVPPAILMAFTLDVSPLNVRFPRAIVDLVEVFENFFGYFEGENLECRNSDLNESTNLW